MIVPHAAPVEGFETPLHASLGSPILLGGAPRAIAILNGTIAAALGLGLPDAASWLVDEERRAGFERAGRHFESVFHATLLWLPPGDSSEKAGRALVERMEDRAPGRDGRDWRADLARFSPSPEQLAAAIAGADQFLNGAGAPYDPARVAAILNRANINAGRQIIKGIDAQLRYQDRLAGGKLGLTASLTYLNSRQQIASDGPVERLAGRLFNPPHWRGRATLSWGNGGFNTAATLSHIGGVKDVRTTPSIEVEGMTTLDISSRYRIGEGRGALSGLELGLSVQNLLNRYPQIISTRLFYDAPYDSSNYSPVGRFIAVDLVKRW
jgi:hypothetical protein